MLAIKNARGVAPIRASRKAVVVRAAQEPIKVGINGELWRYRRAGARARERDSGCNNPFFFAKPFSLLAVLASLGTLRTAGCSGTLRQAGAVLAALGGARGTAPNRHKRRGERASAAAHRCHRRPPTRAGGERASRFPVLLSLTQHAPLPETHSPYHP